MSRSDLLMQMFREFAIIDDAARGRLREVLPKGLTEAQYGVLNHLRFTSNRNETPGDLARLFDVTRPAMTQLLGRMSRAGLVALRPAAHDGRVRHVQLTAAGERLHTEVVAALDADLAEVGRRYRVADLEDLLGRVRRFRLEAERLTHHPETTGDAQP